MHFQDNQALSSKIDFLTLPREENKSYLQVPKKRPHQNKNADLVTPKRKYNIDVIKFVL